MSEWKQEKTNSNQCEYTNNIFGHCTSYLLVYMHLQNKQNMFIGSIELDPPSKGIADDCYWFVILLFFVNIMMCLHIQTNDNELIKMAVFGISYSAKAPYSLYFGQQTLWNVQQQ